MLLPNRPSWYIPEREALAENLYLNRRQIVAGMVATGLLPSAAAEAAGLGKLNAKRTRTLAEDITPFDDATHYNNFYEFGTGKEDPARNAGSLQPAPWVLEIGGLVNKPLKLDVQKLIQLISLEERVYRMRCVEGWSMVIPWVGFSLARLIALVEPQASAKYVAFQTLNDKKQMPGLRSPVLQWPYVEGLRMDEARNPLTMLAVGMYGQILPNQNGAPIRLVVPWKYGFKSIKSIVRISFVERQPKTSWNISAPNEYGFYSNVNPDVDHPRWSQKRERRIGEFLPRRTLAFNGYGEEVAALYKGMNLKRFF